VSGLFGEHAVVLVTGISASGKSSVAETLAGRFPRGVHVRGDTFRRMIVTGREEMTTDASEEARRQLHLRHLIASRVTDAYFEAGFSVVMQDVIIGPALAECAGAILARPLYVVVLCPSVESIEAREADRAKKAYRDGFHPIEALDAFLRTETPRIGLWLDSSELSVEETVDEIEARADEARTSL
jgi:chloramphenicol 3-O-phosphotransferase